TCAAASGGVPRTPTNCCDAGRSTASVGRCKRLRWSMETSSPTDTPPTMATDPPTDPPPTPSANPPDPPGPPTGPPAPQPPANPPPAAQTVPEGPKTEKELALGRTVKQGGARV